MHLDITGFAHVRLTVTDITRSREFYESVFGFPVALELPPDADQATREQLWFLFGGVIYQTPGGLLGLRPVAPGTDAFDEDRIGLDHLSFAVRNRAELDTAAARLDELGIEHDPVRDEGESALLTFRDPDGVALELYLAG